MAILKKDCGEVTSLTIEAQEGITAIQAILLPEI